MQSFASISPDTRILESVSERASSGIGGARFIKMVCASFGLKLMKYQIYIVLRQKKLTVKKSRSSKHTGHQGK